MELQGKSIFSLFTYIVHILSFADLIFCTRAISSNALEMDVSDLPEGIYLIEITPETGTKEVRKILIRR